MYTLLNRRFHSVIDDITGQVARLVDTDAMPPAEETNQVPPGGLNEGDVNRRAITLACFGNILRIDSF